MKRTLVDILNNHAWHIIHCLNLTHFEVSVSDIYKDRNKQKKTIAQGHQMEVFVDYKYLRAEIWYNKDIAKRDWNDKRKSATVQSLIHEICHIIIDELYFEYVDLKNAKKEDIANTYREQATEQISRWAWEMYYDYMEKNNIKLETGLITKKRKKK